MSFFWFVVLAVCGRRVFSVQLTKTKTQGQGNVVGRAGAAGQLMQSRKKLKLL